MTHRWNYDNWLTEYDIFSFFLPMYGILGDRLSSGDIPGWTTFYSSGSPVVGDPSSGWMYLPVMLTFSTMWVATAFKTMILLQLLIGGLATYVFARVIGYGTLAAMMTTVCFAFGPFLFGQTFYATVACQVTTWIPVAFLGVELALRQRRLVVRLCGCAVVGIAFSQMSAAWPGQGMMNGMLVVAGWIAYRGFAWPPVPTRPLRRRLVDVVWIGLACLALGLALSAASLLPGLAVNSASSIANGDYSNVMGGEYESYRHTVPSLLKELFTDWDAAQPVTLLPIVTVLGTMGLFLSGKRHAAPFWMGTVVIAAILALPDTFVHRLFYLIPEFETIHDHGPKRALWVVSLAPAMLAGAAVQELPRHRGKVSAIWKVVVPLGGPCLVGAFLASLTPGIWLGWWVYGIATLTTALALVIVVRPRAEPRWLDTGLLSRTTIVAMIAIAFIAPCGRDIVDGVRRANDSGFAGILNPGTFLTTDPYTRWVTDTYLARSQPGMTAEFLQAQQEVEGPFRYTGYAGRLYGPDPNPQSYSSRRRDLDVISILVNGRGPRLGLEMIQGYNPTHLLYYVQYMEAMNGRVQDYHWLDPTPFALGYSPLFDMLGVEYIVVSAAIPPMRDDIAAIARSNPVVFRDANTVVYRNVDAFDRAWLVHDVQPNTDDIALRQFQSSAADGRVTAYVNTDGALPSAQPVPVGSAPESVTITHYEGDRIVAEVNAASDGLVVFSEIWAEGWHAWVGGDPVDVLRTDHAFRGIPVSAGTHTIEMRYEPTSLRNGLAITGVTGAAVLGVVGYAGWTAWTSRTSTTSSPPPSPTAAASPSSAPASSMPAPPPPASAPSARRRRRRRRQRRRQG